MEKEHENSNTVQTIVGFFEKAKKFLLDSDLSGLATVLDLVNEYINNEKIFHLEFVNNLISKYFVYALLCDPKDIPVMSKYRNTLHWAAYQGHYQLVDSVLRFYHRFKKHFPSKPWLVTDKRHQTPLHVALDRQHDQCAYCLLSSIDDIEDVCNLVDSRGNSPLFLAVKHGCNESALYILNNVPSPSFSGENGFIALDFAFNSSGEVLTRLLDKDPTCIKRSDQSGNTVLHKWIQWKKTWPLEYVFGEGGKQDSISPESKSNLIDLIYVSNIDGDNPFHIAAKSRLDQVCKILANIHKKRLSSLPSSSDENVPNLPWLVPNKKEEMPLGLAITSDENYIESVDEFNSLSVRIRSIRKKLIQGDRNLLFNAIEMNKFNAADAIWDIQDKYGWSKYESHSEMWLAALENSDEEVPIWLAERLNGENVSALLYASKNGKSRLIQHILKKNPSVLEGDKSKVWIEACKRGHYLAVKAFIENCSYFRKLCVRSKDSPLHHLCFETEKEYEDILKIPAMWALKNFQDSNGDTPLHKAIKDRRILLAKVLLNTNEVVRTIKNNEGKTAMDLLVPVCNQDWRWDEMCNDIGIVPGLQMTYFRDKTNLFDVRNTLLVVASLLSTITFAAGFQLPGGIKSDGGYKAAKGDKLVFILFLLSDTVAMCSSMLAVVCFLWSTVCEYNRALLLIDKSVLVMAIALCSTLVAFMTGVYVVMPTKSLWAAILVVGICCFIIFISIRCIMDWLCNTFYPQLTRDYKRRNFDLEEGETSNQHVEGNNGS